MTKKIGISVSDEDYAEVWERFKMLCLAKETKLHGVFSREVTRAVREYIDRAPRSDAYTHTITKHTRAKLARIKRAYDILPDGREFPEHDIDTAIRGTHITHRATIGDYKNFMLGLGLVLRARRPDGGIKESSYEKGIVPPLMEKRLEGKI